MNSGGYHEVQSCHLCSDGWFFHLEQSCHWRFCWLLVQPQFQRQKNRPDEYVQSMITIQNKKPGSKEKYETCFVWHCSSSTSIIWLELDATNQLDASSEFIPVYSCKRKTEMCDITTYSARVSYPRTTSARLPIQQEICKLVMHHALRITKQYGGMDS